MKKIAETAFARLAEWCSNSQSYRFYKKRIACLIDWEGVTNEVQKLTGRTRDLKGGFLPGAWYGVHMPSWAFSGDKEDYIILYPGDWQKRMYAALGKRVKPADINPQEVLGAILAHEVRHIMQGRPNSGLKMLTVLTVMYTTYFGAFLAIGLFMFGLLPWWMSILLFLCYKLAFRGYITDPREVDARRYAKEHADKWKQFITIAP